MGKKTEQIKKSIDEVKKMVASFEARLEELPLLIEQADNYDTIDAFIDERLKANAYLSQYSQLLVKREKELRDTIEEERQAAIKEAQEAQLEHFHKNYKPQLLRLQAEQKKADELELKVRSLGGYPVDTVPFGLIQQVRSVIVKS